MVDCKTQILEFLSKNPDKNISIYGLTKIIKIVDKQGFSRNAKYSGIYTIVRTLQLENKVKLIENKEGKRMQMFVKLNQIQ